MNSYACEVIADPVADRRECAVVQPAKRPRRSRTYAGIATSARAWAMSRSGSRYGAMRFSVRLWPTGRGPLAAERMRSSRGAAVRLDPRGASSGGADAHVDDEVAPAAGQLLASLGLGVPAQWRAVSRAARLRRRVLARGGGRGGGRCSSRGRRRLPVASVGVVRRPRWRVGSSGRRCRCRRRRRGRGRARARRRGRLRDDFLDRLQRAEARKACGRRCERVVEALARAHR
jgi:hypothetical protein